MKRVHLRLADTFFVFGFCETYSPGCSTPLDWAVRLCFQSGTTGVDAAERDPLAAQNRHDIELKKFNTVLQSKRFIQIHNPQYFRKLRRINLVKKLKLR
jgi:hypothetical protein